MKKIAFALLFALLFTFWTPVSSAAETETELDELVGSYMKAHGLNENNFAMGWMELETGETWYFGEDHFMVAGSMYKLPLNMTIYDMLAEETLSMEDAAGAFTVENALFQSIVNSNNDAAQAMRYLISRDRNTYRNRLAAYSGYEPEDLPGSYYSENCISPRFLINTLKYLYDNSEKYPELLDQLKRATAGHYFQLDNNEFPIAHKYGSFNNSLNDCAIVYAPRPFALVVFTKGVTNGETILSELCAMMIEYAQREVTEREPTPEPTAEPTPDPTPEPAAEPTPEPAAEPTPEPTPEPTAEPAPDPTPEPVTEPTSEPAPERFWNLGGQFAYFLAASGLALAVLPAFLGRKGRIVSLVLLLALMAGVVALRQRTTDRGNTVTPSPTAAPMEPAAAMTPEPTSEPTSEPTPLPTVEPTPEPIREPTPEQPREYILSFAGDCTIGTLHEWQGSKDRGNMLYVVGDDYAYPFSGVLDYFANDDFTMVNLEGALTNETTAKQKDYRFRGSPEYAQVLSAGSVEAVTLANNHSGDYLQAGLEETRAALEEQGVLWTDESAPLIVTLDGGMKLGIAAFNNVEIDLAVGDVTGYMKRIEPLYKACVEAECDLILAYIHWGWEYRDTPETWMVRFAHEMADMGFDMVIGSHAHILQPYEEYNGVPIYYGLGNFCYGGHKAPSDVDTVIVRQHVLWDGEKATLGSAERIPCAISSADGYNDFHPVPYEEGSDAWERVLKKLGLS